MSQLQEVALSQFVAGYRLPSLQRLNDLFYPTVTPDGEIPTMELSELQAILSAARFVLTGSALFPLPRPAPAAAGEAVQPAAEGEPA